MSNSTNFALTTLAALSTIAAITTLTSVGMAQVPTVTKSNDWTKSFGGKYAWAAATATATVRREDRRLREVRWVGGFPVMIPRRDKLTYNADLRATVGLFGLNKTLGSATADLILHQGYRTSNRGDYKTGTPQYDYVRGQVRVRVFGTTILDRTVSRSGQIIHFNEDYSVGSISKTFFVGPIPVTVRGSLGGGAALSGGVVLQTSSGNPAIGFSGAAVGYASGSASAGVGIRGASAGISAVLKILNTRVGLEVTANRSTVQGRLDVSVTPLEVRFYIYVEALWWKYTRSIFGWKTASFSLRKNLI
jgi:hypothetical protein